VRDGGQLFETHDRQFAVRPDPTHEIVRPGIPALADTYRRTGLDSRDRASKPGVRLEPGHPRRRRNLRVAESQSGPLVAGTFRMTMGFTVDASRAYRPSAWGPMFHMQAKKP